MTTVNVKGVGKIQFPDSMSRDEIRTVLRQRFSGGVRNPQEAQSLVRSRIQSGGRLTPDEVQSIAKATPIERPDDDLNTLQRFNIGLGRGLKNVGEGVAQAGLEAGEAVGLTRPGRAQEFTQKAERERETFNRFRPEGAADDIGEIAGEALPFLVAPGGQALAGGRLAATAAGRGGLAAAEGAAIGSAQFRGEGESRLKNTGIGAVAGGAGSLALSGAARGVNAIRGGLRRPDPSVVRAAQRGSVRAQRQLQRGAEGQELAGLSRQFDVPVSSGDIRGGAVLRAETELERIPLVGTQRFRARQSQAAKNAAERFLRGEAEDAPEDVGRAIQEGVETRLSVLKGQAKQKYDRVAELAGDAEILPDNTARVARETLEELNRLPDSLRSTQSVNLLTDFLEPQPRSFQDLRTIRTALNRRINDAFKGKQIADEDVRPLIALKEAVEKDINTFARRQGGNLADAVEEANSFYRANLALFKNPRSPIARVFKSEEPDRLFNEFIKRGRGDRSRILFNNLNDEGKQAVRANIVREALEAGVERSDRRVTFSPSRFAQRLDEMGPGVEQFFKGRRKKELQGLQKLMRHIERAGRFEENPPTGLRGADRLLAGGGAATLFFRPDLAGEFAAFAAGGGALAQLATWGLTSKTGRNLMLASSRFQPGSKGMANIMRRIEQTVPRVSALAALEQMDSDNSAESRAGNN